MKVPHLNRRQLIVTGLGAGGTLLLPPSLRAEGEGDPHFLFVFFIGQGVDWTYYFDARPYEMTEKGYKENYLPPGRRTVHNVNGMGTRAPFSDYGKQMFDRLGISVVTGIHMHPELVDHNQNGIYAFEGGILPRERPGTFAQRIGDLSSNRVPVESILLSNWYSPDNFLPPKDFSKSFKVPLDNSPFLKDLRSGLSANRPTRRDFLDRSLASVSGDAGFPLGAKSLREALMRIERLDTSLSTLVPVQYQYQKQAGRGYIPEIGPGLKQAMAYFRGGLTTSAVIMLNPNVIDTHNSGTTIPDIVAEVTDTITEVFTTLKSVPFLQGSMLDYTTVLVGSEFSRTNVSERFPGPFPYSTGTYGSDHNPYGNVALVGGKGIRPGVILGATDQTWIAGQSTTPSAVSDAHASKDKDPKKIMNMGKPFNFETFRPRDDMPLAYDRKDYIVFSNVVNTLYDLFNVPQAIWRKDESSNFKPVLRPLLKKYPWS